MKKVYFIDSENVGDSWIDLLEIVSEDDNILVFYTSKTPNMNFKNVILLKKSNCEVEFIECSEGNNALDFQLTTYLGYLIFSIEETQFIIVSNDTGFDAVVKFWSKREKSIKRITAKECLVNFQTQDNTYLETEHFKEDMVILQKLNVGSVNGVDNNAKELLYILGKEKLNELYNSLMNLYDSKRSKSIYNAFRQNTAYSTFLSKHIKLNTAEKQEAYCKIVFNIKAPTEKIPDSFCDFIMNTWNKKKNLNSFKSSLIQKYGKENGDLYYSLFKQHIKILDIIK